MPYKYFYDTPSTEMKDGDWAALTVKAIIVRPGVYRLYSCRAFVGNEIDPPQGVRVDPSLEKAVAEALFPSTLHGMEPDNL